jgi:hypothetical protein
LIKFAGMDTLEGWKALELLDPALGDSYSREDVLRCIQIGLLCVQRGLIHGGWFSAPHHPLLAFLIKINQNLSFDVKNKKELMGTVVCPP